ncbi:MAG: Sec-independent protein translocase protein TatB [Hyphomicrobium sp.]
MFEISWSELLILAVVTLLFVGPKELPVFLRTIGRYAGMAKRQASEFRAQFDAAMREAELDSMKKEMESMQASVNAEVMNATKTLDEAGREAKLAADPLAASTAAATAVVFPSFAGGLPVAASSAETPGTSVPASVTAPVSDSAAAAPAKTES